MSTALAVDSTRRSVVRFNVQGDAWPRIEAWAKRHKFHERPVAADKDNTRMFQKGNGLWTSPMRAQFVVGPTEVEVQAWVHNLLLTRLLTLFILPQEMSVKSGGLRAVVPRNIARNAVNELLREMNAPPIP